MGTFIEHLDEEAQKRGWTRAKLAIKSGLAPTTIYNIANGNRRPGNNVCNAVADGLKLPREEVFRWAGILLPKTEEDGEVELGKHYLTIMNETHRKQAIEYLEFLVRGEKKDNKSNTA